MRSRFSHGRLIHQAWLRTSERLVPQQQIATVLIDPVQPGFRSAGETRQTGTAVFSWLGSPTPSTLI